MNGGGTIPSYTPGGDSIPALLSPGTLPADDEDYVCERCRRGLCHRCTEFACTCCSGNPGDAA